MTAGRQSVAVVGAGVAGLTAAHVLSSRYDITLYEAEPRLGGHAHTHSVPHARGAHAVDSGFIVHNDQTYPLLRRLFREVGVEARPTEMSMSIIDEATGLEYAGGKGPRGVLAQRYRTLDPKFLSVIFQVPKLHRAAKAFLDSTDDTDTTTYGEFLAEHRFTERFHRLYAIPLVACVWSMEGDTALGYPARYLFRFLDHHGLLAVSGSPQWYTVVGGSRSYVDAVAAPLHAVRSGRPVTTVLRHADGVRIQHDGDHWDDHDAVVIATHADQALRILGDATREEKETLGAFRYSKNQTVLHTDDTLLPRTARARSSWNYLLPSTGPANRPPIVTYWMNLLQGIDSDEQYLVTLNATDRINPEKVVATMEYEHPIYDLPAITAQASLPDLSQWPIAFAGAYHGWGFHEDGCRAGVEAARALGVEW